MLTQLQINNSIAKLLIQLAELNPDLYSYWTNVLYTVDSNFVEKSWTQANLNKIRDDVMYNWKEFN